MSEPRAEGALLFVIIVWVVAYFINKYWDKVR